MKSNYLVLDTAPLIKNTPLDKLALEYYTVPEVIAEVKVRLFYYYYHIILYCN